MEESRRDLEARKRRKVIEKLRAAVKRKVGTRSRSGSRDRRKKKRDSDSGEDSREEESEDEEAGSGDESAEEGSEEGEEGSDSEGAVSDATTGTQKSEETPDREDSEEEEGELEDDDNEEEVGKNDEDRKKSRSRSRTPIEGRWADRSSSRSRSRTPSRSPTPMREDTPPSPERDGGSPPPVVPQSGSGAESPSELLPVAESPAPPLLPGLPPYLPSVHGCRSVAEFKCLNRIEEGTYGVVYRAMDKRTKEIVALKRLKMEREKEGFPITSLREINTLLISQHPNVVHVREIVVGSNMDQIYIVMDSATQTQQR